MEAAPVFETLDCRNVVETSYPTTVIEIIPLPCNNSSTGPAFCYHDGFEIGAIQRPAIVFRHRTFCSLSCAIACKTYGNESSLTGEEEAELFFLYGDPCGLQEVVVAPERCELACFGGTKTLTQFRNTDEEAKNPFFAEISSSCLYDCYPLTEEFTAKKLPEFLQNAQFCSYNCMLSYVLEDSLIGSLVETKIRNCVKQCLIPAPARSLLKKFGGFLTIEEFRNTFRRSYYKILQPNTLISSPAKLMELASNVSSFESHVEVHHFDAVNVKPGEYEPEPEVKPMQVEVKKDGEKKFKKKTEIALKKQTEKNTCVVKISAGSGKILGSSKNIPAPKACSGKLPFKRV